MRSTATCPRRHCRVDVLLIISSITISMILLLIVILTLLHIIDVCWVHSSVTYVCRGLLIALVRSIAIIFHHPSMGGSEN